MSSIVSQDLWVDTDQGKLFAKRWSPASIPSHRSAPIVLQDCGHVPHREKTELVLDLITSWLADANG